MIYALEGLDNKTGDQLAEAIRTIPAGVTSLVLLSNELHRISSAELAQAFRAIPATVTSLDLRVNALHNKSGAELALAFRGMPDSIREISLDEKDLAHLSLNEIITLGQALPHITYIDVCCRRDSANYSKITLLKNNIGGWVENAHKELNTVLGNSDLANLVTEFNTGLKPKKIKLFLARSTTTRYRLHCSSYELDDLIYSRLTKSTATQSKPDEKKPSTSTSSYSSASSSSSSSSFFSYPLLQDQKSPAIPPTVPLVSKAPIASSSIEALSKPDVAQHEQDKKFEADGTSKHLLSLLKENERQLTASNIITTSPSLVQDQKSVVKPTTSLVTTAPIASSSSSSRSASTSVNLASTPLAPVSSTSTQNQQGQDHKSQPVNLQKLNALISTLTQKDNKAENNCFVEAGGNVILKTGSDNTTYYQELRLFLAVLLPNISHTLKHKDTNKSKNVTFSISIEALNNLNLEFIEQNAASTFNKKAIACIEKKSYHSATEFYNLAYLSSDNKVQQLEKTMRDVTTHFNTLKIQPLIQAVEQQISRLSYLDSKKADNIKCALTNAISRLHITQDSMKAFLETGNPSLKNCLNEHRKLLDSGDTTAWKAILRQFPELNDSTPDKIQQSAVIQPGK